MAITFKEEQKMFHIRKHVATVTCGLLLAFSLQLAAESKVVSYPTFEILSGAWKEKEQVWRTYQKADAQDLDKFAANYHRKASLLFSHPQGASRIPRTIHFIWIGPRAFPEESISNVLAWKELHPDWTLKFWTDSTERPCPVKGMEKHHINEIKFVKLKPYLAKTKNYGEQADLLRYEILLNEGGMYVDHDVRPYRSFNTLHTVFDFYVGLENPHINAGTETKVFPCNCLFGAKPGHPIIQKTIDLVAQRWEEVEKRYPKQDTESNFNRVINRTFHSFTMATKQCLNRDGNFDMVLPSSFFFAYKLFADETIEKLKANGFVYAKHDFAAVWTGKKPKSETEKNSVKNKDTKNKKR